MEWEQMPDDQREVQAPTVVSTIVLDIDEKDIPRYGQDLDTDDDYQDYMKA